MNNKYNILISLLSIILIIIILLNINIITYYIPLNLSNFINYTFPPLFVSMFISKLLIELNIQYYLSKFIKDYSLRLMILSFLTGFPNNIIFMLNDYKNKIINEKDISYLITFTTVISPIYLIKQSFKILNNYAITTVIIYYLIHIIIFLLIRNNIKVTDYNHAKKNINIKDLIVIGIPSIIQNLLNICAIIIFFQMFSCLINNSLLKGLIEFTSGINSLYNMNYPLIKKGIILLMILLFNSFSIFIQMNYYLKDININYKNFIYLKVIITILFFVIGQSLKS